MKYDLQPVMQAWNLSDVRPFDHIVMSNNFVTKAYSHECNCDVVIKIGPKLVIDREVIALDYFQGDSCVRLLKSDKNLISDATVLMLEYVSPGSSIKDLYLQGQEEQAFQIFIQMVRQIHQSPLTEQELQKYEHVQTVAQKLSFLDTFESNQDRLRLLLPQAIAMNDQLITTQDKPYFLHGDLHHENILLRRRKPEEVINENGDGRKPEDVSVVVQRTKSEAESEDAVMIDPQGVIGELCYEMSAFLYNPVVTLLEHDDLVGVITHRFDRLEQELGFDRQRMIEWSFVRSVLAACYYEEDNQDADDERTRDYFVKFAELIVRHFL